MRILLFGAVLAMCLPTMSFEPELSRGPGARRSVVEEAVLRELSVSLEGRAYVIVVLKEPRLWSSFGTAARRQSVRAAQQVVLEALADGELEIAYRYRNFAAFTGWVDASGLAKLAAHPLVASVGPDARGELRLDSSRPYVGADRVETELSLTGRGATVVVADTGIDTDHPDLADSIAEGAFHFLAQGTNVGPGAEDDTSFGHGVAMSGIVTSNGTVAPRGIAPDADLLAIKVVPNQGELMASDVNAAVDYVVSIKDRHDHLVAINLSLGFYFPGIALPEPCPCDDVNAASRLSQMSVQAARDAGILTFGASGNMGTCGPNGQMGYPECVTACVAVGSVHDVDMGRVPGTGTFHSWCVADPAPDDLCQGVPACFDAVSTPDTPICFTDRTECTQLVAPGWDIVTTRIGGGRTEGLAGTSVSSPHAAAVAALLAGRCLSPDQVLEIMKSTGRRISDGCPTDAHEVTVIDAFAAVSLAEEEHPLCSDCNRNSVPDEEDLQSGASLDCDGNSIPDECDPGCNQNGIPDACDLASGASMDCNDNGIPDECDVVPQGFSLAQPVSVSAGAGIAQVIAIDIDGDSHVDLAASSSSPPGFSVLFGGGDGSFLDPVLIGTGESPFALLAADWSGDGLLDLAAAVPGTPFSPANSLLLCRSQPGRTFAEPQLVTVGSLPGAVIAADLDGDHDLELATVNEASGDVAVLRNLGNGELADAVSYPAGTRPAFLAVADWEGDGDLDFVVAGRSSKDLSVLANDGKAVFSPLMTMDLGFAPAFLRAADLSRDGRVDIVSGGATTGELSVFLRNPDGTLAAATSHEIWPGPVPVVPADVLVADVNGDSALDVVTADLRIDTVSVLLNRGDGMLRPAIQFDGGDGPRTLAAARFKARAGLDIVAAGSGAGASTFQILINSSVAARSLDGNVNGKPDECETRPIFHRGDPNSSGTTDISDGVDIFGFLFLGGAAPTCRESADVNNNGTVDITDGISLLNWLFLGGPEPAAPGPTTAPCGVDPDGLGSPGDLGCEAYGHCN